MNRKELDQGVLEFHRRVKCGEDSRALIAKAIPLQKWFTSSLVWHVFIEAIFDGEVINKHTNANLYIVKVQNQAHETAVSKIVSMFEIFDSKNGDLPLVGGCNTILPGCVLRPDSAIRPGQELLQGQSEQPTGILEVEFKHSLLAAHTFCCQYFPLHHKFQVVIPFKFYPRLVTRTFAALAVQYRGTLERCRQCKLLTL